MNWFWGCRESDVYDVIKLGELIDIIITNWKVGINGLTSFMKQWYI